MKIQLSHESFMHLYSSKEKALRALLESRVSSDDCLNPNCRGKISKDYKMHSEMPAFICGRDLSHVYPQAGAFGHCKLGPKKLFDIVYRFMITSNGYTASQARKDYGHTYVSMYNLLMKIREHMAASLTKKFFNADIEVDEKYPPTGNKGLTRRYNFPPGRDHWKNTPIVALVQRNGPSLIIPVRNAKGETLEAIIEKHIDKESCTIYTDDWKGYNKLSSLGYKHVTINHSASENRWVNGPASTNNAECQFSLFSRLMSTYRSMSHDHLADYCVEAAFRYSFRNEEDFGFKNFLQNLPPLEHRYGKGPLL